MKQIQPAQLIEALITQSMGLQEYGTIALTVHKFNELNRLLTQLKYHMDFSYGDLLEFASKFHNDIFIVDEIEVHLHASTQLIHKLQWYNKMFLEIQEPQKIFEQWKKLGK